MLCLKEYALRKIKAVKYTRSKEVVINANQDIIFHLIQFVFLRNLGVCTRRVNVSIVITHSNTLNLHRNVESMAACRLLLVAAQNAEFLTKLIRIMSVRFLTVLLLKITTALDVLQAIT
jgi:hypothetical protein